MLNFPYSCEKLANVDVKVTKCSAWLVRNLPDDKHNGVDSEISIKVKALSAKMRYWEDWKD